MNKNVPEIFGSMVFNDSVMKNKLPKEIYKSLRKTIEKGNDLDIGLANVVAAAMKDWAGKSCSARASPGMPATPAVSTIA